MSTFLVSNCCSNLTALARNCSVEDKGTVYVNSQRLDEPYVPAEYRDAQSLSPVIVPQDNYFVLGDHRSSSNDSRAWGTVERKHIYGKAVFVYWPLEKMGRLK